MDAGLCVTPNCESSRVKSMCEYIPATIILLSMCYVLQQQRTT